MATRERRIEVIDPAMAEVLRRKTPAERLEIGSRLWVHARDLLRAHLGAKHPEWSEEEVDHAVARRLAHGPD